MFHDNEAILTSVFTYDRFCFSFLNAPIKQIESFSYYDMLNEIKRYKGAQNLCFSMQETVRTVKGESGTEYSINKYNSRYFFGKISHLSHFLIMKGRKAVEGKVHQLTK